MSDEKRCHQQLRFTVGLLRARHHSKSFLPIISYHSCFSGRQITLLSPFYRLEMEAWRSYLWLQGHVDKKRLESGFKSEEVV